MSFEEDEEDVPKKKTPQPKKKKVVTEEEVVVEKKKKIKKSKKNGDVRTASTSTEPEGGEGDEPVAGSSFDSHDEPGEISSFQPVVSSLIPVTPIHTLESVL